MVAPIGQPWLGSYDPYERSGENLRNKFDAEVSKCSSRERRREIFGPSSYSHPTNEIPKKTVRKDPLIEELESLLKEIQPLKDEAESYTYEHINQDFRRINASLLQYLLKLDRVNVEGRDDARQLRKTGIRMSESGADTLMGKIHADDYRKCDKCLKL